MWKRETLLCVFIGKPVMNFDGARDSREKSWVKIFEEEIDILIKT